jgi:Type II secretion system (T2SS), protein E, N-terminal domain
MDHLSFSPELALVAPAVSGDAEPPARPNQMSSYPTPDGMFLVDQQPPSDAPPPVAAVPSPPPGPSEEPERAEAVTTGGAMRDVPLGTLIVRAGLVAAEQLEDALQEGMRTGQRLGEVLTARRLIEETDLARLLAGQQGLPFVEAETLTVDPAALALLTEETARAENALAFAFEDGVAVVAVADPTDGPAIENLRRTLGVDPRLVVAAQRPLARRIQGAYATPPPAPPPAPAAVERPTLVAVETEPAAATPIQAPAPLADVQAAEPTLAPEPVVPPPAVAPAPAPVPDVPAPTAPAPLEQPPPATPVVVIAETPPAPPEPAPVQLETTHSVVLRLTGEDRVEIGAFGSQEEAETFARAVVGRITNAEELGEWPLFGQRFIRPQGITSVDVVERSGSR